MADADPRSRAAEPDAAEPAASPDVATANTPAADSPPAASPGIASPAKPRRPWYRLHASTWVVFALLSICLFLINVPGDNGGQSRCDDHQSFRCWEHGWPWTYRRQWWPFVVPETRPYWLLKEGWSFESSINIHPFNWQCPSLLLDAVLAIVIVLVGTAAFEWWRRRRRRVWQLTIADLLLATLLLAAGLGWWRYEMAEIEHEERLARDSGIGERRLGWDSELKPRWLRKLTGIHLVAQKRVSSVHLWFGESERGNSLVGLRRAHTFKSLRSLNIFNVAPDDTEVLDEIETFSRLKSLTLLTSLHGSDLARLAKMQRLEDLHVELAGVTAKDLQPLSSLPRLQSLALSSPILDNNGLAEICRCRGLRRLVLTSNEIDDEGLESLANLPELESLCLTRCEARGRGLAGLAMRGRLRTLSIDQMELDREGLEAISAIGSLEALYINASKLPVKGLLSLRRLPSRMRLEILATATGNAGDVYAVLSQLEKVFPDGCIMLDPKQPADESDDEQGSE